METRIRFLLTVASIGSWLSLHGSFCSAATTDADVVTTSPAQPVAVTLTNNYDWINQQWTGDDRPFAQARISIDRLYKVGMPPEKIVSRYQELAAANPRNALLAFQFVYAAVRNYDISHPVASIADEMFSCLEAAEQPHTYNYSRLMYVLEGGRKDDIPLGRRLFARDPNDKEVELLYALSLSTSPLKSDEDAAKRMIESIESGQNIDPAIYYTTGFAYANIGYLSKDPDCYKKAIEDEDKFLSLTSTDDWRRGPAAHCAEVLQKRLASGQ